MRVLAISLVAVQFLLAGCGDAFESEAEGTSAAELEAAVIDWRERRFDRLTEPYGWLSLVGLDFVADGVWRVGSDDDMDIVMPTGPGHWGDLHVEAGVAEFEPAPGSDVQVDGHGVERARLHPADGDDPVLVSADTVRFQIISRDGALAVRTRWPEAEPRSGFVGLEYFDFDPDWVIEADFEYHEPGTTIPIASVLGDLLDEPNLGRAVFDIGERRFSLEAVGDENDEELFIIFADRTSGRETYGLGRFLYADQPVEGRITLDFNRAYNPPCAFNEFTTCPLPPPENRLDIRVEAGELAYQGPGGWQPGDP